MKRIVLIAILLIIVLIPSRAFSEVDAGNIFWKVPLGDEWVLNQELTKRNSKAFTNLRIPNVILFVIYSYDEEGKDKSLDWYFNENTPYALIGDFLVTTQMPARLWAMPEMKERADFGNTFGHFFHVVLKSRQSNEYAHFLWAMTFCNGGMFEIRALGSETSIAVVKPEIKKILGKIEIMDSPLGK